MQCVFCDIVARRAPANVRYEDAHVLVFDNVMRWAPVMLLVVPKAHLTQAELWQSPLIGKVAAVGAQMGTRYCPSGFRLLANVGADALQTQEHGHLHVLGGAYLGPYL